MRWSERQDAVLAAFVDRYSGNVAINSVAGGGKTTVLAEGARRAPESFRDMTCLAFNTTTTDNFRAKLPEVQAKNFHQLGWYALRRAYPEIEYEDHKDLRLAEGILAKAGLDVTREHKDTLRHLAGWAKDALAEPVTLQGTVRRADFDPIKVWREGATDDEEGEPLSLKEHCALTWSMLEASRADLRHAGYSDQCWLPVVLDTPVWRSDLLLVDEVQDACPVQLALMHKAAGDRVFAVGDPSQSLYSWRGADARAFARYVEEFQATEMPLSVSYRCPTRVLELARHFVPHIEAAPGAPRGGVGTCDVEEIVSLVRPGDFVLSRSRAPLAWLAPQLREAGLPVVVKGAKTADALLRLVIRSKATSPAALADWVQGELAEEAARAEKKGLEGRAEGLRDHAATLLGLTARMRSIGQIRTEIRVTFGDQDKTKEATSVVLSTVHGVKGLERPRVFVLDAPFQLGRSGEEKNIAYVAVTRAQEHLIVAYGAPWRPTYYGHGEDRGIREPDPQLPIKLVRQLAKESEHDAGALDRSDTEAEPEPSEAKAEGEAEDDVFEIADLDPEDRVEVGGDDPAPASSPSLGAFDLGDLFV